MATLRNSSTVPYICRSCRHRISLSTFQKRRISENVIQKRIESEWQWKAWAQEIKAGQRKSMLSILEERGYINQITGSREELDNLLTNRRIGAYCGIDPTASSMHVGHMIPFMALFWLYLHGYHSITLLGGATAKVGDPTGRLMARENQGRSLRAANTVAMHYQLKKLWNNVETVGRKYGYERDQNWHRELANNSMWLNKASIAEVLSIMGTGLRMGAMLSRDTVKNRMEKGDGMSFSEFCYPILQAWDWWHMYSTKGIQLQIGGADQFGNIVSGMDAIKYIIKTNPNPEKRGDNALRRALPPADHDKLQNPESGDPLNTPMGFTVPLMTTSSGEKFGKSAGNAVWLDKEQTSVFNLYGYFVGTPDADVERMLKMLTFVPLEDISRTMEMHNKDPSKRIAQHLLASEFVDLIHGQQEARSASEQHQNLVANRGKLRLSDLVGAAEGGIHETIDSSPGDPLAGIDRKTQPITHNNAPSAGVTLPLSLVNKPFARVLFSAGLAETRSEAQRLVQNKGAYVGSKPAETGTMDEGEVTWTPIRQPDKDYPIKFLIDSGENGRLLLLRQGKWKIKIVRVVSDDEFERLGLDAPGWKEFKDERDVRTEYEAAFGEPYTPPVEGEFERHRRQAEKNALKREKRAAAGAGR